jgi:hypothetical protein
MKFFQYGKTVQSRSFPFPITYPFLGKLWFWGLRLAWSFLFYFSVFIYHLPTFYRKTTANYMGSNAV